MQKTLILVHLALHNYFRNRCGYNFEDTLTITGLEDLPHEPTSPGGLAADNIRKVLSDYLDNATSTETAGRLFSRSVCKVPFIPPFHYESTGQTAGSDSRTL
jgi:hypothetical protein